MKQTIVTSTRQFSPWNSGPKVITGGVLRLSWLALPLLLTACLDMPVSGSVAGESMGFVATQWTVSGAVIASDQASANGFQVVLSDQRVGCAEVGSLAAPGKDGHSLGLSLVSPEGEALVEGLYRVGGAEAEGQAAATFVYSRGSRVLEEQAKSGQVEITALADGLAQGYFDLQFESGSLSGVFNSSTCDAP